MLLRIMCTALDAQAELGDWPCNSLVAEEALLLKAIERLTGEALRKETVNGFEPTVLTAPPLDLSGGRRNHGSNPRRRPGSSTNRRSSQSPSRKRSR